MPPVDPISYIFGRLVHLRASLYQRGLLPKKRPPGVVIGIGNLTWGGSGKTPFSSFVASWAQERGFRPAIISRGYGGKLSSKRPVLVTDGNKVYHGPKDVGDEPFMLAKGSNGYPVLICKERFRAICFAYERLERRLFILDDAFQHMGLERDLDILLLTENALKFSDRFSALHMREPFCAIKRAHCLVYLREGLEEVAQERLALLRETGKPLFFGLLKPRGILNPDGPSLEGPKLLRGMRVFAFAGIARPKRFLTTLELMGAKVVGFMGFKDHHFYREEDLREINRRSKGADIVVSTEKDWVRIMELRPLLERNLFVLLMEMELEEEDVFFEWLSERIQRSEGHP